MTTHKVAHQSMEHQQISSAALGVFAGILVGGLAGATTMWLIAPKTGKQTRAQIKQKSLELRDRTVHGVDEVVESINSKAHQLTDGVRAKTHKLQQQGRKLAIKQLDHLEDKIEDALEDVVAAGKTAIKNA
jgi:gas vesicle protein